jgi:cell division protein FtsL
MNALPSPRPSSRPVRLPQRRSLRSTQRVARSRQNLVAVEVAIKLGVNVTMAIVAISALARLIPYNLAQSQQLNDLRTEVLSTQSRVDALQASLEQNFDPQRSRQVMQEQSHLFDPNQKRIIWLRPTPLDSQL